MEGNASTAGNIKVHWPRYYWLSEHDKRITVLVLGKLEELQEVEEICRAAVINCDHDGVLGDCIGIEQTTIDDWLDTH